MSLKRDIKKVYRKVKRAIKKVDNQNSLEFALLKLQLRNLERMM